MNSIANPTPHSSTARAENIGSDTPAEITAVLFDYGLVLSGPPNPAAWQRMRHITAIDEAPFYREYWAHRHPYDRGDITAREYFQRLAVGAGRSPLTDTEILDLLDADTDLWTDLNLPMVEWAQALQKAGIRTGILSNLGDSMNVGVLRKFPWISSFHHCTWSHTLKIAKPEPEIYAHAAHGLNTPPQNILFVDDRLDNIEAAHAAGMQAIQYLSHPTFLEEMRARGLAHLLDLTPLPTILR